MESLLPSSSSKLERNLEKATARSSSIDAQFDSLWNPWTCPLPALPWLAWAVGVKEWSMSWPEARQRSVIASSMDVRRSAGTVSAIKKAIYSLDIQGIDYSEWYEHGGQKGTYRITATLEDRGMTQEQYDELLRVIRSAGRLSAWMDPAGFTVIGRAKVNNVLTSGAGSATTLLPLRQALRTTSAALFVRGLVRAAKAISVYPSLEFELKDTTQKNTLVNTQSVFWSTVYPTGD